MKIDTILQAKHVYTMEGEGLGYRQDVDICTDRGKILSLEDKGKHPYQAEEEIHLEHHVVLPGFIDAHMHTGLNILRGLAQDTSLWMMHGIGPFEKALTEKDKLLGSKVAILEAARYGTTTIGDYETGMEEVCQFLAKVGLRGQITSTIREAKRRIYSPGQLYEFDPALGEESFHENLRLFEKWHNKHNMRIFFGPQGADFVSPELLLRIQAAAKERNTKIHMHVQQGDRETYQIEKRYGKRPIVFLEELGYLDETLLAVHLTDCNDEEARLVAKRGTGMIFCPCSIGIIDGIVPPADVFSNAGGFVALGSDQAPGNNSHNIIKEMYAAALFTKIKNQNPEAMPAWKVLRMATIEGAKACGTDDLVGSLEVGKRADIIALDLETTSMSPVYTHPMRNLIPNLVYSARGDEVAFSMVDGKVLFEEGNFVQEELRELLLEMKEAALRIGETASKDFHEIRGSNALFMEKGLL